VDLVVVIIELRRCIEAWQEGRRVELILYPGGLAFTDDEAVDIALERLYTNDMLAMYPTQINVMATPEEEATLENWSELLQMFPKMNNLISARWTVILMDDINLTD
jgi:hypothetical protein